MGTAALYALVVAVPFAGTSLLLPLVKRFCLRWGWLDHPGGRKQHRAPVPRLGGIAFFVSFATTVLAGVAIAPYLVALPAARAFVPEVASALSEVYRVRPQLLGLFGGALVIFLVGFLDDVLGEKFPFGLKLLGQSAAAGVAVAAGVQVEFTGVPALNAAVSFFWILGISNAFNFLDNMDGLAA
ncbi:MAG TPA: hypothetical protein VIG29_21715, partial [Vicinamibacteria bacterium]